MASHSAVNLSRLMSHLIATRALSLAVLKVMIHTNQQKLTYFLPNMIGGGPKNSPTSVVLFWCPK